MTEQRISLREANRKLEAEKAELQERVKELVNQRDDRTRFTTEIKRCFTLSKEEEEMKDGHALGKAIAAKIQTLKEDLKNEKKLKEDKIYMLNEKRDQFDESQAELEKYKNFVAYLVSKAGFIFEEDKFDGVAELERVYDKIWHKGRMKGIDGGKQVIRKVFDEINPFARFVHRRFRDAVLVEINDKQRTL